MAPGMLNKYFASEYMPQGRTESGFQRFPFRFYTPTEIEAKGWNLSCNRTPFTVYLSSVMVSHMIATLIALF